MAEGIPPSLARYISCGKHLDDPKTFDDYSIEKDTIIHCVLHLRGGASAPMPFNNLQTQMNREYSQGGPSWRRVCPGLNLIGFC